MRRRFRVPAFAFAVALAGLVCVGSSASAGPPAALAQAGAEASDDDGSDQTEDRPEASDEGQAAPEVEDRGPALPLRLGDSRRIDPFDVVDDDGKRAPHPAALGHPGHDVVVCEAGCDRTAGSIVYMKERD